MHCPVVAVWGGDTFNLVHWLGTKDKIGHKFNLGVIRWINEGGKKLYRTDFYSLFKFWTKSIIQWEIQDNYSSLDLRQLFKWDRVRSSEGRCVFGEIAYNS